MKEWIIPDEFLDEETLLSASGQGYLDELVRCKECKNYDIAENGCNGFCSAHAESMYPWDFCSSAKGKEEWPK